MDASTAMYVELGIHGLANGMVLFLIASGLTLVLGMMGILNLAHANLFMLSAYIGYQMVVWTNNFWLALLIAPILTAFVGILMEQYLLKKVHAYGPMAELILTLGVAFIINDAVKIIWGTQNHELSLPESLSGLVNIGVTAYPVYRLFLIVLTLLILGGMTLILYKTRLGMVVRAAVSDSEMVNALGINVPLVFMSVFGAGTWMAGVAGVAIAPILQVSPGLAGQMGMDAFIAIIVAGFGSIGGAFFISIICGLLTSYGVKIAPGYESVLLFVFMAVVLAIKPEGLFGEKE